MYFIIKMQQECILKNIFQNLIIYDILKSQHLNKSLHWDQTIYMYHKM